MGAFLRDYVSEEGERSAEHKKTTNVQRQSDTTFQIRALHMHGLHVHACTRTRLRHQHNIMQHDSATCSSMLRDVFIAAQSQFLATPVIEMTVLRSYIVEGLNRLPGDQPRFSSTGAASLLRQIIHQHSYRPGVARTRNVSASSFPFISVKLKRSLIRHTNAYQTRSRPTGLSPLLAPGHNLKP